MKIEKGQVMRVTLNVLGEVTTSYYFYTGETSTTHGMLTYVFCKCVSEEELNPSCFWQCSEPYLEKNLKEGNFEFVNTWGEVW